jgi:hypothetical protein
MSAATVGAEAAPWILAVVPEQLSTKLLLRCHVWDCLSAELEGCRDVYSIVLGIDSTMGGVHTWLYHPNWLLCNQAGQRCTQLLVDSLQPLGVQCIN